MCKCNTNNTQTTTQCHVCHQKPKCPPKEPCDCAVKDLSTNCILYDQEDLPCSNIKSGQSLSAILLQLDTFICNLRDELIRMFTLKNIGNGARIYKGIDSLGRKELRTITKTGNIITVTENSNEVSVGIDEEALDTFIEENQKTYSIVNVGTNPLRVNVYKDSTIVGDNTQFNFRTIVQENQGSGESFLRDIQQNTDDLKVRVKTLVSDNLTITATDEEVRIETPLTSSIPALYVNNLYKPTYQEWLTENKKQNSGTAVAGFQFIGKGTLAQPFTDTVVYTLNPPSTPPTPPTTTPNTAIQNALDGDTIYSYVGSGTKLNPEKAGQKIIIQNNNTEYTFSDNFNYNSLNLEINGVVNSTTSGYILDMEDDTSINQTSDLITIEITEGSVLNIQGDGFRNNGNTIATNTYQTGKIISLKGDGSIRSATNNITKYLLNVDITNTGNNNDGNLFFDVRCNIQAEYQGVYKVGGNGRIDFYNTVQSGTLANTVNTSLQAFVQTGGQVRFWSKSSLIFEGSTRNNAVIFTPSVGFTPKFYSIGASFSGTTSTLFNKTTTNNVVLEVTNSQSGYGLTITNIFNSPNLWSVIFKDNTFSSGIINSLIVDLTNGNNISCTNTIGNTIIESLVSYVSRESARLAGLPTNSVFLIKKYISADNLIAGVEYKITTEGTPSLGTEGTYITATGSETGTGVGMYTERCILA